MQQSTVVMSMEMFTAAQLEKRTRRTGRVVKCSSSSRRRTVAKRTCELRGRIQCGICERKMEGRHGAPRRRHSPRQTDAPETAAGWPRRQGITLDTAAIKYALTGIPTSTNPSTRLHLIGARRIS